MNSSKSEQKKSLPTCTLDRFVRLREREYRIKSGTIPSGELSELLTSVALAVKVIGNLIARSSFSAVKGYTADTNVQGEVVHHLDREADRVIDELLSSSGHFGSLLSEEREDCFVSEFSSETGGGLGKYVLAFDPLDGSSNLGTSIPVGTIFCIFRKPDQAKPASVSDFLQSGREIVAAGYGLYGARTEFVFSSGQGVHSFTLDPAIGEFVLVDEALSTPQSGSVYSVNEGNFNRWAPSVQRYITALKQNSKLAGSPYSLRYCGSLVADFDRNLRRGGVFLYPGDSKSPNGKLRLIYECFPLAFLAEQAGGRAVSIESEILDITPTEIHQRTPFIVGSREEVELFRQFISSKDRGIAC